MARPRKDQEKGERRWPRKVMFTNTVWRELQADCMARGESVSEYINRLVERDRKNRKRDDG